MRTQPRVLHLFSHCAAPTVVRTIHKKILRYRRQQDLPCVFVHVVGSAIDAEDNTGVEELRSDIMTADSNARFERANPLTGEGVTPLFDGIVHKLVKPDEKVMHPISHSRPTTRLVAKDGLYVAVFARTRSSSAS